MHFSRLYFLFISLVTVGLLAHAKPIERGLAVHEDVGSSMVARHYPENPCNCGQDLVDVLVDLHANVQIYVGGLTGPPANADGPGNSIIAALNAAAALVVKIVIVTPFTSDEIAICVTLLVEIILAIIGGLNHWPIGVLASLSANIDIALSLFLKASFVLCPSILVNIVLNVSLLVEVVLLGLLGFVDTLAILGL